MVSRVFFSPSRFVWYTLSASNLTISNNYSGAIGMRPGNPDYDSGLKALVAATPVLGAAARTLARIPVVKKLRRL